MAAIPSAQGQTLAADTSADVVSIETLRASVAGQLVARRQEYARVTAELTSHNRRGAAHAHERQAALEATITRLAPDVAAEACWADEDALLIHAPGSEPAWCRLCRSMARQDAA